MHPCSGGPNEKWKYENKQIIHVETGLCLDFTDLKDSDIARMEKCEPNKKGQLFDFKLLNEKWYEL